MRRRRASILGGEVEAEQELYHPSIAMITSAALVDRFTSTSTMSSKSTILRRIARIDRSSRRVVLLQWHK